MDARAARAARGRPPGPDPSPAPHAFRGGNVKTADRRRFLAGGLALAGLGSQEAAAAQEPQTPLRVGVVAFRTCFEKYDRMKEVEEEIRILRDGFAREAEDLRKKIETFTDVINGRKEPD